MKNKIIKSSLLVMALTIVSKGFGFVKSIIQASYFGSTEQTDAFNMAYGIVGNIIYMLTTAIAVAIVPLYIQKKETKGLEETRKDLSKIVTFLGIAAIVISVGLFLGAPVLIKITAPVYTGKQLDLTIRAFQIMILGVAFSLETNLFQNILNSEHIYGFSAFASIINSIVLILFIILGHEIWGIYALIFAVPVSYLIQYIFLYVRGKQFASITLKYGLIDDSLKQLILQMLPILISNATIEINQVVDRALLTGVETGAVTAVSYAAVLYQFVANIIAMPISSVLYTELTENGVKRNLDGIGEMLRNVFKILLFISVPCTIIILFASTDIVQIIYGHGKFSGKAIIQTADALSAYGLCVFPVSVKLTLTKAYYALKDTKRPMMMGICEVITNIGLSILMARYFGIIGVVGATAVASSIFVIVMELDFSRQYISVLKNINKRNCLKILISGLTCMLVLYKGDFGLINSNLNKFLAKVFLSGMVYLSALFILKEETLYTILKIIINKIREKR